MQFARLRYFIEVERCGSIRDAAKKSNVAASAISRQITNLEEEIDIQLFERRPRGMLLTDAGRIYADYAKRVISEHDRMISEVQELTGQQRGHIRISTVEGMLTDLLNKAVAEFCTENPNVTFSIATTGSGQVITDVRNDVADVGLTYFANPDAGVKFYSSLKAPLCAVMSPNYDLGGGQIQSFKDTVKYPLAIPISSFGIRNLIDTCCKAEGILFKPALETNSIGALCGFARFGGGITFITQFSIQQELADGTLIAMPLEDEVLNQTYINTCVVHDRRLPIAITSFLDYLQIEMQIIEKNL
jgi:DNA-binding transcriptional LysR family regulator